MRTNKPQRDMAEVAMRTVFRRCLLFFLASGIAEELLREEFERSMKWAKGKKVPAKIFRAGSTRVIFEICQHWLRNASYLNAAGNPIALPIRGPKSIESIMSELAIKESLTSTVKMMLRIGSIKPTRGNKYLMPTRGFYARRDGMVAFEPYAQFLVQAVTTATLPIDIKRSDKHSYWLSSTRTNLSNKQMTEFVEFVKRKGHSQLVELDEWFLALHKKPTPIDAEEVPKNTVGVGMFTFVTEPNSP